MIRAPEHFVHGLSGPVAVLEGKACACLNRVLRLDKFRIEVRGQDADLDNALMIIKLAATAYAEMSGSGRNSAPQPDTVSRSRQQLNNTVSTTTAAAIIGVTDRTIRRLIAEKRLTATKVDGRYRIARDDLANYQAAA